MSIVRLIAAALLLVAVDVTLAQQTSPSAATPANTTPADAPDAEAVERQPKLTYGLSRGADKWPAEVRQRITAAMDEAVAVYNQLGVFDKHVTANYNPGTPTADANYDGWINFGGQMNTRVALHEIGHTLGIGTHREWRKFLQDRQWTGSHALAQLRAFDGPEAVLKGDRQHFWPYGLNYDKEDGPEQRRRHVLMVAAFRRDLGIASDTQAE